MSISPVEKARLLVLNLADMEGKERVRRVEAAVMALCDAVEQLQSAAQRDKGTNSKQLEE